MFLANIVRKITWETKMGDARAKCKLKCHIGQIPGGQFDEVSKCYRVLISYCNDNNYMHIKIMNNKKFQLVANALYYVRMDIKYYFNMIFYT